LDIKHTFGRVVAQKRAKAKLSQEKLCEAAGIDRSFLSEIENGKFQPSLVTIFLLAKGLKCSATELIAEVEARRPSIG
jgi:transcriptional regulator with XRE-family HTH domain